MTERVAPAGDRDELVRRADLARYAWRHSLGRMRTSPEEFLAVSGLSEREQQLLRERYHCDDDKA